MPHKLNLPGASPFRQFVSNVASELDQLHQECSILDGANRALYDQIFHLAIEDVKAASTDKNISASSIKKFQEKEKKRLHAPLEKVLDQSPDLSSQVQRVKRVMDCFFMALTHIKQVDNGDVLPFIENEWAQNYLTLGLKNQDARILAFCSENKEHSIVRELILNEVKKGTDSATQLLIEWSEGPQNCEWAQKLLIESIEGGKAPKIYIYLGQKFKTCPQHYKWMLPTWFKWINQNTLPAAMLLISFCSAKVQGPYHTEVFTEMVEHALSGEKAFQVALTVMMGMFECSKLESLVEAAEETRIRDAGLSNSSKIWLVNSIRWSGVIEDRRKEKRAILGTFYREFRVYSMAIESLFEMHLFFLSPATFPRLSPSLSNYFPQTDTVLMGGMSRESDGEKAVKNNQKLVDRVARDLERYGVSVCHCSSEDVFKPPRIRKIPYTVQRWVRDYLFFGPSKNLVALETRIPNFFFDGDEVLDYHYDQQEVRHAPHEYDYESMGAPLEELHMLGVVVMHWEHYSKECRGMRMLWTYGEGGNFKFGEDKAGNRFAIIGKDTLALNQGLIKEELEGGQYVFNGDNWEISLEDDLETPVVDEDFMKLIFARDYGIDPQRITFVEQPHKFHIDMGMTLIGPQKVLLNDSVAALEVSLDLFRPKIHRVKKKVWAKRVRERMELAKKKKILEDKTEQDLQEAGFEVIRVPGVFQDEYQKKPVLHQVNFFNHIGMTTTVEGVQKKIIYSLACPKKFGSLFENMVRREAPFPIDAVHYLTSEQSRESLKMGGGVNCLTKLLPCPLGLN